MREPTHKKRRLDPLSPRERSEQMRKVKGKDTRPELAIRRLVHGMGYRYRLYCRTLPGIPDLVFPSRKKVIFIHGCFWHRHTKCPNARFPKTRREFWVPKLTANKIRDKKKQKALSKLGYDILVIWECEIKDLEGLKSRIRNFLDAKR